MKQIVAMLSGAADGAMVMDQDGTVVFWNRAAERLLGFQSEEVLGRPCHDVLRGHTLSGQPLCSPSCQIGRRLAGGGGVRNFDMQTHTKTGRLIWLNISSLPMPSKKKDRFWTVHLFRDITAQAKVRQLVDELQTALGCTGSIVPEAQAAQVPAILPALPLSEREREVLQLLAQGKNTKIIADSLCISPATVRNHIQHILEKLGAHTRLQALAIAFHLGARSA